MSTTRVAFDYAVLRACPRRERGERVNIGVLLYCQQRDHLQVLVHVDEQRLRALDPRVDVAEVRSAAQAFTLTCAGEGAAAQLTLGQRFRWLTAPRSTVVHTGPVHSGLTDDPAAETRRLLETLVR